MKLPFVLSCECCGAGDGIPSKADALRLGWTHVRREPDGESYNDLGVCPECRGKWPRQEEEHGLFKIVECK